MYIDFLIEDKWKKLDAKNGFLDSEDLARHNFIKNHRFSGITTPIFTHGKTWKRTFTRIFFLQPANPACWKSLEIGYSFPLLRQHFLYCENSCHGTVNIAISLLFKKSRCSRNLYLNWSTLMYIQMRVCVPRAATGDAARMSSVTCIKQIWQMLI